MRPVEWRLVLFAGCVRIALLAVTTSLDLALPDYDTSNYIRPGLSPGTIHLPAPPYGPANATEEGAPTRALLQGWLVWDSVFYADIASRGYVFEQYYAFFPLLPALASWASSRVFPLLALAINAVSSVTATVLLFRLGERLTRDRQLSALACVFFVLNPATIFFSAAYTEAAFAAATLTALYWLYCRDRLLPAVVAVAVSCGLRSNGVVNAGFLGHYCLTRAIGVWPTSKVRSTGRALQGILAAVVSVVPLVLFQYSAYATFCRTHHGITPSTAELAGGSDAALAPASVSASSSAAGEYSYDDWPRPWCHSKLPYVYGFVQAQYWNVGFLRYWTLQQLPNFLLAAPVLLLSISGLAEYVAANRIRVMALGLASLAPPLLPSQKPVSDTAERHHRPGQPQGPAAERSEGSQRNRAEPAPAAAAVDAAWTVGREGRLRKRRGLPGTSQHLQETQSLGEQQLRAGAVCGTSGRLDSNEGGREPAADRSGGGRDAGRRQAQQRGVYGEERCDSGNSDVDVVVFDVNNSTDSTEPSRSGYLHPELAVFMYPWAVNVAVALTTMHVQVATRFLLSSCPPLYWYMAHVWLRSVADGGRSWCCSVLDSSPERRSAGGRGGSGGEVKGAEDGCGRDSAGGTAGGVRPIRRIPGGGGGEVRVHGAGWGGGADVWLWRWCLVYMALGCVLFINFLPWT